MALSHKRKREKSQPPQLDHVFQSLNPHDPWKTVNINDRQHISPRSHQSAQGTKQIKFDNFEKQTPALSPAVFKGRDHSKPNSAGKFKSVDIPKSPTKHQPFTTTSPSSGKRKHEHKHRDQSQPSSSPFVPDAVSTPAYSKDLKPIPISVPVDRHLNDRFLRARQQTARQRAMEKQANLTFTSHVSSSSSTEETSSSDSSSDSDSSDETGSDGEESDSTPSPKPKKSKMKKLKTKERASSAKSAARQNDSNTGSDGLAKLSTKDTTKKKKKKSKDKLKDNSNTTKSKPTTKQTNQNLESHLFTSLTSLIPPHLTSHARVTLTSEVQSKAKTSHSATPYPAHSSGPSDRTITLRAARDLIVRLSEQRLAGSLGVNASHGRDDSSKSTGQGHTAANANMESDLARIANERGKRIEILEMENRGLKGQVERARVKIEGAGEDAAEDGDESPRKKKRRKER